MEILAGPAIAGPVLGLDWMPLGRADLVWLEEEQTTGTLVGEFDGLVRPSLTAFGGIERGREAWLMELGLARVSTVTWDGEGYRRVATGTARLAFDWNHSVRDREPGTASAWIGAGVSGTIPQALDSSDLYSDEEQADADEGSQAIEGRIGGVGGRVGLGASYHVTESMDLGMRYHLSAYRGQLASEDSVTVSWRSWGEAGVRLTFRF